VRYGFFSISHKASHLTIRPRYLVSMSHSQVCVSPQQPEEAQSSPRDCACAWVSEVSEIIPAVLCAFITWEYTSGAESSQEYGDSHNQLVVAGSPDFLIHPSPWLMLVSCLTFGCCVSSFVYRRQQKDPCQAVVFILAFACVGVVGYGFGASANMIMLGYLPAATCASMTLSVVAHSLVRCLRARYGRGDDEEKPEVLG